MESHDELLQAAIAAQDEYLNEVSEAKLKRQKAFARAINGTVTAVELGKEIGLSNVQVSRIARGKTR